VTRLWLVRHGPTHAKAMCGWTDLPADLSDTAALDWLRATLPAAPVVSSDLIRAVATADALQASRPRLPHDPALREMHFGRWEGRTHAEAEATDPFLIRAFWDDPGHICAPGGESWNGLAARVRGAVARHAQGLPDLIVVAHFGAILSLVQRARAQSAVAAMAQHIAPLSLTELHIGPHWTCARVNETAPC
jgi:alpha-ribazole phosphatase